MTDLVTILEQRLSALDKTHRALGAQMGDVAGVAVPLSYGDVQNEYSSVREGGAGLIDLSSRSRLNVSGSEAVQFLNGLITNDVKSLSKGTWMAAALPTVQGRLLASVRVLHHEGGFIIDTETATGEVVRNALERFTLAGDFRVTELTDQLATISVQGSLAGEVVESVLGSVPAYTQPGSVGQIEWDSHLIIVIRVSHTSEDGFDLFVPSAGADELWKELRAAGAAPVGFEALEILRIESGIPRYGVDVDVTNVVLEAGLDDAVSFTKGCYIGQEIIARIHWRGHVAKKISGLVLDEQRVIQIDDKVHSVDGKEIGRVSSTCFSPRLERTIALCMLKYDYLAPDTELIVHSEDSQSTGRVVQLPFVVGSWNNLNSTAPTIDS